MEEVYDAREEAILKGLYRPTFEVETEAALVAAVRLALPLVQPSGPDEEDIPETLSLALAAFEAARKGHYDEAKELLVGLRV